MYADQIHAARFVRKTHRMSVAAFTSPSAGPIGHIAESSVRLLARPADDVHLDRPTAKVTARVPVMPMTLGDDGTLLPLLHGHVDGPVVAAFGARHVPAAVEHLQKFAEPCPL